MHSMRTAVFSVLTLAACAAAAGAQEGYVRQQIEVVGGSQAMPMPPPGQPLRTGTGRIRGRVVTADSGTPVRRAQVRLSSPEAGPRSATTDGDGRFEFADLPDGHFSLLASKAGYVNVQYGQTRPFETGKQIDLAVGAVFEKADIALPRGGVIAGRIVDELGEPVADVAVTAMRQQWAGGRRRLVSAGRTSQTNDLGQFRMYGLPPGDYVVNASVRNAESIGFGFEMMSPGGAALQRSPAPASGYAPTYYPGTPSPADAQKIPVALGQDAQGTDFALVAVRLVRIAGIVLNSEGRPVEGAMVSAMPSRGADVGMMAVFARTGRDGSFTLNSVAPGDYTLQVRAVTVMTSDTGGDNMMVMTRVTGGGPGGDGESGSLPVSVSGEDLANVVITTTKGATATGHVTFEGARPASAGAVRVTSILLDPDGMMMPGMSAAAQPADGTFELKGLTGTRTFRVNGLPAGWTLKAVQAHGVDVTDSGVEFKGGEAVSGIEILVSPRATEITGAAAAADGSPAADYTVVIFADDPQKWAVPSSRWIAGTRPDQAGTFRVRNLPPGSYYAIAVDYVAQGEWNDPELLDRLKSKAQRFTLGEGERRALDLKVSAGGQ